MRPPCLWLLLVAPVAWAAAPFSCASVDVQGRGRAVDVSSAFQRGPLTASTTRSTPPSLSMINVTMDLCKPLPRVPGAGAEDQCPDGTNVCMIASSRRAGLDDRIEQVVPSAGTDAGLILDAAQPYELRFRGRTWSDTKQSTQLHMLCDKRSELSVASYDAMRGVLTLTWRTPLACSAPRKAQRRGSSLGWWIVCIAVLYVAVGMWYNYQHYGARGWDMLPHRDAWRDVPYYVRDLSRHMTRAAGGSAPRSGYEAV